MLYLRKITVNQFKIQLPKGKGTKVGLDTIRPNGKVGWKAIGLYRTLKSNKRTAEDAPQ